MEEGQRVWVLRVKTESFQKVRKEDGLFEKNIKVDESRKSNKQSRVRK